MTKVLVTGASGFVGSHIVDSLQARATPTAVLLRPTTDKRFLSAHLPQLDIRSGSITDPATLSPALSGITHVIHCAGCTKARNNGEFDAINHLGTRNLVEAVNNQPGVVRFLQISSLAVTGPATREEPAREDDRPRPISAYGQSKLAAERAVRELCRVPFTVIRPPAVYGPRDYGFFSMFQAVDRHLLPRPNRNQFLSLVFAKDLAEAVVTALQLPAATGRTYFAAAPEPTTGRAIADEIARQMKRWTIPVPLPALALWPICFSQELFSRVTGRATLLNLQKFAELRAPGWVCDSSRLQQDLGIVCGTSLQSGISQTLAWYREQAWLPKG